MQNYRDFLGRQLAVRQARNPRYSLRAFARDLDVSPSRLCEVMKQKHRLSRATGLVISTNLGLSAAERDHFCDLIDLEHPTDPKVRAEAGRRVKKRLKSEEWQTLQDELQMMGSWSHLAILELFDAGRASLSVHAVATRLGIGMAEAEQAMGCMVRLGLLKEGKKGYVRSKDRFCTTAEIPSESIRSLHEQFLHKAQTALHEQAVPRRAFNSLVIAIPKHRLDDAKARLHDFVRSFTEEFYEPGQESDIYCLASQLFALTQDQPRGHV